MKKTISKLLDTETVLKMCASERDRVDEDYKVLMKNLEEDQRDLLFDIVNDLDCIADRQTTQGFVQGFRLATKLMIDVFC